jgi:hypothetical protein
MRYPYKYAMPVDPRVLKNDFESKGLETIPQILAMLKHITPHDVKFNPLMRRVDDALKDLWFKVDANTGINLRDREKLIPVFQEYARLSKNYRSSVDELMRGVHIPTSLGTPLTDEYGEDAEGWLPIRRGSNVKKILENLAYGLRSWATDRWTVEGYSRSPFDSTSESVVFTVLSYKPTSFILEGDAVRRMDEANNMSLGFFDPTESILFLKNPKILNIFRDSRRDIWRVNIKE